jgi:SdpI/YfhL protein family
MVAGTNIFFGILNIACGIVFILISVPLVNKKVPMNRLYGFRISKSFVSDDNWYEINRYGGRQLIRWSILLILIGLLYFIFPIEGQQDRTLNVLLAVAPILICPAIAIAKTLIFSREL